ncbi:AMP-binding protein [Dyadobacter chenhuakuii]|uniref:AMP-binding protein n=1 Tax=Dyadobacter chenhuakuii TaxID=2909339 RepID=A0ABY4XPB8_9BACT|nr:AMP-binding protein [Dyadobacter chenhuakuii]MCF2494612.1 AMP-binding protein [Dyadobacter chenhuakuii]USJ32066.1 AMP-binding protein [Dyadobacter chenhuakuii]
MNNFPMPWNTSISAIATQERPEHFYFAEAYDFMQSWLNGQHTFTLQTSGSTGAPKPIQIHRSQLIASAQMTGKALGLRSGTRALVCLNVHYIAGLMMLVRGMELDWEMTVIEPSANPLLDVNRLDTFDFTALVPLQLGTILENSKTENQVNRLGTVLLGGAPVNVSLQRKIESLSVPVYQSYGMTETVSHIALRRLNGGNFSEDYQFLPNIVFGTDDRGCLHISGPVTNGEVVQTNDLVEIAGNTFKWIGRADNVINSGGVKIVLDKVDATVGKVFFDLKIGNAFFNWFVSDEKLGQKLILVVEGTGNTFQAKDMIEEIRKSLSAYETPKHVYFVQHFNKTTTDKVDKRRTVQQLLASQNG